MTALDFLAKQDERNYKLREANRTDIAYMDPEELRDTPRHAFNLLNPPTKSKTFDVEISTLWKSTETCRIEYPYHEKNFKLLTNTEKKKYSLYGFPK
jgi:hypothetical protein